MIKKRKINSPNGRDFEDGVSQKVSEYVHYSTMQEYEPYNPTLETQIKEAWLQAEAERLQANFTYGTATPDLSSLETLRQFKQIMQILLKNPEFDVVEDEKSHNNWLYTKTFADVNGDGRADFVYFDSFQNKVNVLYSNRKTRSSSQSYLDNGFSFDAGGLSDVLDIDNDGRADFVGLTAQHELPMVRSNNLDDLLSGKVDWAYRYNNSGRNKKANFYAYKTPSGTNNLLYSMTDGGLKSVTLTYGSSNVDNTLSETYPIIHLKNHDTVVTNIDFQLGGGFSNQVTYTYHDRKFYTGNGNRHEKKLLGFASRNSKKIIKSPQEVFTIGDAFGIASGSYTQLTIPNVYIMKENILYHQYQNLGNGNYDVSLAGSMYETDMTYVNKSDILAKTTFTYEKKPGISGIDGTYWVATTGKKTQTFDGTSPVVNETTAYDAYGNELVKSTDSGGEIDTIEKVYYTADTDNWILGRIQDFIGRENGRIVKHKKFTYDSNKIIDDEYRRETTITYDGLTETHVTNGFSRVKNSEGGYSMEQTQVIDTTEVTRNYRNQIVSSTRNGKSVTYNRGYDNDGYRYIQVVSNGKEISYQKFDTAGNKIYSRDRNTGETTMKYDVEGKLLHTINSAGEKISYEYNNMYKLKKIDKPGNEGDIIFT